MKVIRALAIVSTATTLGLIGCGEEMDSDLTTDQSALTTNY